MNYPRVLIVSQTFDSYTGPGITNTNLFLKWKYENIAIISKRQNEDWSICGLQYLIGHDEIAKPWPFSLFQKHTPSIIIRKENNSLSKSDNSYKVILINNKKLTIKQIFRNLIKTIFNYTGISLFFNKIKLSENLSNFIEDFHPEIIYSEPASHELICFVSEIHDKYKIPIAIHVMDDLLTTIYKTGLLGFYWNRKTNRAFRHLIDKSSVHLTISDAMSIEYKKRYGNNWIAFHNPVDKTFMNNHGNEVPALTYNPNRILYLGRIGNANEESIFFIIHTIINLNLNNKNIEFVIYTRDYMYARLTKLSDNKCIKVMPDVPHNIIPSIQRTAGALILPLDFSKSSQKYARYSMPTKTTEYMASGVPILVFAPPGNAVTKYARSEDWGYVVDKFDKNFLQKGIVEILKNNELRYRVITNAKRIVVKNHDAETVRKKFHEVLSSAITDFDIKY